jgi:hypothetical protein
MPERTEGRDLTPPSEQDRVYFGNYDSKFLLLGSAHPTIVQRIGAWLLGVFLVSVGLFFAYDAYRSRSASGVFFAGVWMLGGALLFRNGFRRRV